MISELRRKNYRVSDLDFTTPNAEAKLIITHEGKELFGIEVSTVEEGYFIDSVTSSFQFASKFLDKYLLLKELTEKDLNVKLADLQSRFKEKVNFYKKDIPVTEAVKEAVTEAVTEAATEATTADGVPTKEVVEKALKQAVESVKAAPVEVTIKRPAAVGLEGQLQSIVFDVLESEFTTRTLQNKMVQLGIEPNRTEVIVKKQDGTTKNAGVQHREFKRILQTISAGVNLALVGPAGSGKTTIVHKVADSLNLPFYSKSVSAQTGVHEFFGYQDANGNYVRTLFREAFEKGGVFLLDEYDAGNPNVLAAMNQATANGSCAFADGMVTKHEDFIVVMAGNTFGHGPTSEYVGRMKIDVATLDRFAFLFLDYDETFERSLATNKDWCKEVQRLRKIAATKKIKMIISPRATFDGAKLLSAGISEEVVKEMIIYKGLNKDEIALLK